MISVSFFSFVITGNGTVVTPPPFFLPPIFFSLTVFFFSLESIFFKAPVILSARPPPIDLPSLDAAIPPATPPARTEKK